MSYAVTLEDKIQKKMQEIQSIEEKLKSARIYLQALHDIRKELIRVEAGASPPDVTVRKGSMIDVARECILTAGRPQTLDEIISALGREATRENRAS